MNNAGMTTGTLSIDLDAIAANWRALDARSASGVETAAVVKADAYGLGVERVAATLAQAGVRTFFVAVAEEGLRLRKVVGQTPEIMVFSGHMAEDSDALKQADLTPLLNSPEQFRRHMETLPDHPFGIQLDTGMNRLGFEPKDWRDIRDAALAAQPVLIMSHLACADEPDHEMNVGQLSEFHRNSIGLPVRLSLAATGGILLGKDYHFDLTRPGVGLYGGLPFTEARPVVRLSIPVIQTRDLAPGETVGYGNTWTAPRPSRIATLSAGYADGLLRAMSGRATLYAGDVPCALVGRVSMDLLTVDVTDLDTVPDALDILNAHQTVDTLADAAGTIGYEILTSLGPRYRREYTGGRA